MSASKNGKQPCPICYKEFEISEIEIHANKCIFLNSIDEHDERQKRKRTPSPKLSIGNKLKSPRTYPLLTKKQSPSKGNINQTSVPHSMSTFPKDDLKQTNSERTNNEENEHTNKVKLNFVTPLAKQVAPKHLKDFFGQNHILGKNTVLTTLLEKGEIPNMILWGPPGCGKTSLSGIIRQICKTNSKKFVALCAADCGVKDVQNIVSAAKLEQKFGRQTILFMDEVHRFNKKQQDTFLTHVEKGDIILIGATTENPSFSINSALLSRCRVIVMEKLSSEDLFCILKRALNNMDIQLIDEEDFCTQSQKGISIEKTALTWLADISDGDARIALTNLQLVIQHNNYSNKVISIEDIKSGIEKSHMLYDRKGEEHYNIISAMHKSIRASNPDAALYWTTRMIVSGEDPLFIARRMVRAASEDIGNADPQALQLAVSTMQGCQLLGMPEADVLLAQCAIYLARAPKSREADSSLAKAKKAIMECKGAQPSVPLHLRNAPTKLMKDLGYGKNASSKTSYMPPGMESTTFFN